jgi:hypothetical protein
MAERRVLRSGKDRAGDITSLCGAWGSTPKGTAIAEILGGTMTYFVQDSAGRRATVRVVNGSTGRYLRTDPSSTCSDNLDNLPDC